MGKKNKRNQLKKFIIRYLYPYPQFNRLILHFSIIIVIGSSVSLAVNPLSYISPKKVKGCFTLCSSGVCPPLHISSQDYPGVIRVLKHLQADIKRVTNIQPELFIDTIPAAKEYILVGTLGKNPLINRLVHEKKLNISDIKGKWETFLLQVVENPFPGVDRILVITGSDKRGTIFGIFDLSEQIGVSPWYWWADVPVKQQNDLFVLPGHHTRGEPRVKYRGIFINDEAPALTEWVYEKYGGYNHHFYEQVFELLLRLKANYLWPAMWGSAFNDDDPLNPKLADEYGIVMGTSHHEPMMRAHQEWKRYGSGQWNYDTNETVLREFWKKGIQNMGTKESIVTIGMRGDGDEPMSEESNISLLERIVKDQRTILAEVTGKEPATIPQLWALYKEVQDYYNLGMRVPEDVTLLLCDDNWGNIRRLPKPGEKKRAGGYGIYYHFDFVGGPRSYKWLNTSPIPRIWEQMHLAYQHGVDRIWIVNVGDIKPMELPISFFLDYAWDPDQWTAKQQANYVHFWAEQQFGREYRESIADILAKYTKYNGRRKPELLDPDTYSLIHYREAERVVTEYNELAEKAEQIYQLLPDSYKDAYYQLVLYPVKACANLNDLYVTVGKNRLYALQGRAAANELADRANDLFNKDAEYSHYYNKIMANGKWNHMMDQTHIGYTYWQQPDKNSMPEVKEISLPDTADMGVAIEGSDYWWPAEKSAAVLPEFDPYLQQSYYIEIFNRGELPFDYTAQSESLWVIINPKQGRIEKERRLWVSIDWQKAPAGKRRSSITIRGPENNSVVIQAVIDNPGSPKREALEGFQGFFESNGFISMEAVHHIREVNASPIYWQCILGLGRTLSAMTPFPVTAPSQVPGGNNPHLEYGVYLFREGKVTVHAYLSPTLNIYHSEGLRYAVSFDDQPPQVVNIHKNDTIPEWRYPQSWNQTVSDNIKITSSEHIIKNPGEHILKFWMVDPGIVLQKLVLEIDEIKPCYLGPPESWYILVRPVDKIDRVK
jgi:hypothetical protein